MICRRRNVSDKIRKTVWLLAASLSAAYYAVCRAFTGAAVSWLWIWPALTLFGVVRYIMLRRRVTVPKWLRRAYYALLAAFLLSFAVIEGQILAMARSTPEPGLDHIITLGAAVIEGKPSNTLILRTDTAAAYLFDNPDTLCIASGGVSSGETVSEAACIRDGLNGRGIDGSRILTEDGSHDTEDNIRLSLALIPEGASVGVVSDGYHLFRASLIAEQYGRSVSPIPSRTLLPLGIHFTVREYFAVVEQLLKSAKLFT